MTVENMTIEAILKSTEENMQKNIESLKNNFTKIRTGRAHPNFLDQVMVEYYGVSTPLKQVASVVVEDATTLKITPWEKAQIQPIEKAIMASDLGLNPTTAGEVIHVPIPPLTEARRKELVKVVHTKAEDIKVAVRHTRRDALSHVKELLQDKQITEDEEYSVGEKVQKITDKFTKIVDETTATKEKDLMEI